MKYQRIELLRYRNGPIDHSLARLVLSIVTGQAPPELLWQDWLTDYPMHVHDLSRLLWRATKDYVLEGSHPTDEERRSRKWVLQRRRWEMNAMDECVRKPNLRGLAVRCIAEKCRKVLNIDHLGRSLDVTGRFYEVSANEGGFSCGRDARQNND